MKTKLFGIVVASIYLLLSCTNEAIDVTSVKTPEPIYYNTLAITVDPSDLFSSYTYEDTRNNIKPLKTQFQTFNSESNRYIQWRTLIYNNNGQLVGSLVEYLTNTNSSTKEMQLLVGDYYAVTTLTFTDKEKNSMWNLLDEEKMSTVKLEPKNRFNSWSVMSQSSQKFTIDKNDVARIVTVPKPVGCIVYSVWENFGNWDTKVYGDSLDEVSLYTKDVTESYNLDPNATNRYNMLDEPEEHSWYYQDYKDAWFFYFDKRHGYPDLEYSYSYIFNTDKAARQCYGYTIKGVSKFRGSYGNSEYKIEPGKTYLSYWDYNYIGNPYFGEADNKHWDRSK